MATDNLGASFSIDVTNLKAGLAQANRLIRESETEFKAAAAGMDDWSDSQEGLQAQFKNLSTVTDLQKKKVSALQEQYNNLVNGGMDPASKEAVELRTKINSETAALNKNEKALAETGEALKNVGESGKEAGAGADEASKGFSGLKSVAGGVGKAVAAVGAACAAAVTAFFSLAESTREGRENMAKLETAFTTAGHSAEDAQNTYNSLYSILGDDGQATEAAAHLAQLTDTQQELADWTNIAAGVYATFGDSLPIEGLTEAANETAKVGQVTGPLADALNWAGVSEDEFNESLAACSSEQERQALITSTLNGLYSEAAAKYQEVNGDVIAAQAAQAKLNETLNELGAIAEPIMTTLKMLTADVLASLTPFVALMGEGLSGALAGASGAAEQLASGLTGIVDTLLAKVTEMLPFVLDVILQIVPQLLTALLAQLPGLITTLLGMVTSIINALSGMLPQIIASIIEIIPQIINALVSAVPQLLQAALTLLMAIVDAIPTIVAALIAALPSVVDAIINALIQAIPMLIQASIQLLMAIVDALPTILNALQSALPTIITTIIDGLIQGWPMLLQGAIQLLMAIVDALPVIIKSLITQLPQIAATVAGALIKAAPQIFKAGWQMFFEILKALGQLILKIDGKINELFSAITNAAKSRLSAIIEIGRNIVEGIWDGISNATDWLIGKINGFCTNALDSIKSFFGIHSPSKVMAEEVGEPMAEGIAEGIKNEEKTVVAAVANVTEDAYKAAIDAQEEYEKNVANETESLLKNITDLSDKYLDAVESRTTQLAGSLDLFKNFEKGEDQSVKSMTEALESQIDAIVEYHAALASLKDRGISEALFDALSDKGIDALPQIISLANSTAEELENYDALYNEKMSLAHNTAVTELESMREETQAQIQELIQQAQESLAEYAGVYTEQLSGLGIDVSSISDGIMVTLSETGESSILALSDALETTINSAEVQSALESVGSNAVKGVQDGLVAAAKALYLEAAGIAAGLVDAMTAELDINSPSKVFADKVGKNIALGIGEGFADSFKGVQEKITGSVSALTDEKVSTNGRPTAGKSVVVNQTNNYAQAHSRYEIYKSKEQTAAAIKLALMGA